MSKRASRVTVSISKNICIAGTSAKPQSFTVSRQFQVPMAHEPALLVRAHGTLPVDCAGGQSSVVLLIVEQWLEFELSGTYTHLPLYGVGNSSSRRCPASTRAKFNIGRLKNLHVTVAAAKRAAGPALLALRAANAEGHQG